MATVEVQGVEGMQALLGKEIGPSEWRTVTQADIDAFAELSGDDQWIHVDVERAKSESPFGTTIAHGNLTLSLVDGFRKELISSTGFALGVNYGWNKIRFPAPVPVDSKVRGKAEVVSIDEKGVTPRDGAARRLSAFWRRRLGCFNARLLPSGDAPAA